MASTAPLPSLTCSSNFSTWKKPAALRPGQPLHSPSTAFLHTAPLQTLSFCSPRHPAPLNTTKGALHIYTPGANTLTREKLQTSPPCSQVASNSTAHIPPHQRVQTLAIRLKHAPAPFYIQLLAQEYLPVHFPSASFCSNRRKRGRAFLLLFLKAT